MFSLQRKKRQPSGLSETNRHPGREHMSWSKVQAVLQTSNKNMALLRKLSQVPSMGHGWCFLNALAAACRRIDSDQGCLLTGLSPLTGFGLSFLQVSTPRQVFLPARSFYDPTMLRQAVKAR